ncbi:MAG: hypothetical protein RR009_07540 [Oscillospiraceae bacterium]
MRIEKAYPNGGYKDNKFAITKENLTVQYSAKSEELLNDLPRNFIKSMVNEKIVYFFYFSLIIAIIIFVFVRIIRKKTDFILLWSILSSCGIFTAYNVGYYFMLRYLMPAWEFGNSADIIGFSRYEATVIMPLTFLLLFACFLSLRPIVIMKNILIQSFALVLMLLPFFAVLYNVSFAIPKESEGYREFEQIDIIYNQVPKVYGHDSKLIFYTGEFSDNESYYNNHIFTGKYLTNHTMNFNHTAIDAIPMTTDNTLFDALKKNDYLIVVIPDGRLYSLLDEIHVDIDFKEGICYEIEKSTSEIALKKIA